MTGFQRPSLHIAYTRSIDKIDKNVNSLRNLTALYLPQVRWPLRASAGGTAVPSYQRRPPINIDSPPDVSKHTTSITCHPNTPLRAFTSANHSVVCSSFIRKPASSALYRRKRMKSTTLKVQKCPSKVAVGHGAKKCRMCRRLVLHRHE